ncbi:alpha/beta hydrolase [Mycobacterium sp. UM_Kg27]|uniref:alpha/beta hydrolase n=1 Tax=Mycobacterium sp. UM_Kg27 TaxID=1545693 RepID=UPI00061B2ECB|nr:alpha/beta hydrolase [Mycobacterium sp. UM_Kg27]
MPEQRGAHAAAVRRREADLATRMRTAGLTDHLLAATVHDAAAHARAGGRHLHAIHGEIRDTLASPWAPVWDTPAGARHFQLFLAAKLREICRVVADGIADNRFQTGRLRSSGSGYGVPARLRDRINRQALADDIRRVANPTSAISPAELARYQNALRVRDGLAVNAGDGAAPVLLLTYEPAAFGGRGRAAIAIGDPDTADNVTVLVPGAHSSVRDGYLSHPDGRNVYREVVRSDPDRTNSVVVWMGYRAPDSLFDPAVTQPAAARAGGRLLAADVNSLMASHVGGSHVTVVGHSYGSTAVADAAASAGLRADDVVLVGSPGTDLAHSANDFHLPAGGHVYVGAASSDPITGFGGEPQLPLHPTSATLGLGVDPAADGYGSTRFKAETHGVTLPMSGHSSYFDPGGESLFSIGDIASGHGDALANHHMTALHRRRLPAFDPERLRPGTGNHRH